MQSAIPSAAATPITSQVGVVERFQGLPVGEQIAVAGILVGILIAVVGGVRWWIERSERLARERHEDERIKRTEQESLVAKQAAFAFTRSPDENPVGVGGWGEDRMLVGELYSVGMADASRVNVRAFLNDTELPHLGSWPSEQRLPVGSWLNYMFRLPYKVEPPGQKDRPRLDDALANAVVRFDVRFTDASAANRVLTYCYRFDRAPLPHRWRSRQIECSANPETEHPVEN